jgi:hypothetical protein
MIHFFVLVILFYNLLYIVYFKLYICCQKFRPDLASGLNRSSCFSKNVASIFSVAWSTNKRFLRITWANHSLCIFHKKTIKDLFILHLIQNKAMFVLIIFFNLLHIVYFKFHIYCQEFRPDLGSGFNRNSCFSKNVCILSAVLCLGKRCPL